MPNVPREATPAKAGAAHTEPRFTRVPNWLLPLVAARKLHPAAAVVFLGLAKYANNRTGICWPSQQTLAADTGLSRRQVQRYIADLVAVGALEQKRRGRTSNSYRVVFDATPMAQQSATPMAQQSATPMAHELDSVNQTKRTRPKKAKAPKDNYLLSQTHPLPAKSRAPGSREGLEKVDKVRAAKAEAAADTKNRHTLQGLLEMLKENSLVAPRNMKLKALKLQTQILGRVQPDVLQRALAAVAREAHADMETGDLLRRLQLAAGIPVHDLDPWTEAVRALSQDAHKKLHELVQARVSEQVSPSSTTRVVGMAARKGWSLQQTRGWIVHADQFATTEALITNLFAAP